MVKRRALPLLAVVVFLALGTLNSCVTTKPEENPPIDNPGNNPGNNPGETPGDNPGTNPDPGSNPGTEDTKPDFPENNDQAEESITITAAIDKSAQEIISAAYKNNQNASAESIADKLDDLDEVESATVNEEGNIVVKQSDGVYLNILLDTFKEGNGEAGYGNSVSGGIRQSMGTIRGKSSVIAGTGKGGQAIMLCPLYDEDIVDMKKAFGDKEGLEFAEACYSNIKLMLEGAGYKVDPWYNGDANLERFSGTNLAKYDAVVIVSHGARRLTLADGKTKATCILTGEVIKEDLLNKLNTGVWDNLVQSLYKLQKNIDSSTGALCMTKKGTHFCLTGPWLRAEAPSFKDSWIMLLSCQALADDDLYGAFNALGAGGVTGFTESIGKKDGLLLTQNMVSFMASGVEMDDAIESAKAMDDFGNGETITARGKKIFTNKKKSTSKSFYLYDSTPTQIKHEFVNEKAIDLSWTMHPSPAQYYYTITVNDKTVYEGRDVPSNDNVFTYTYFPGSPGDYKWTVSAALSQGSDPFVSAEDSFNVAPPAQKAVNLGLSVNWAERNIGADDPELAGSYFSWGETSPKSVYDWNHYLYGSDGSTMEMYNDTDGITELLPSDDAATVVWGSSWRMPTREEWAELRDDCDWTRTKQNGVSGFEVSGKRGTQFHSNTIFLPDTGYYDGSTLNSTSNGYYWTSSVFTYSTLYAYVNACETSSPAQSRLKRNCGVPIRAVERKGAGNYAILDVYPSSIDFGDVGDSDDISRMQKDFRIINTGKKDAVVSVARCPEGFLTSISGRVTVAAGSTYYGKITLVADDEVQHSGTIEFSSDAGTTLKINVRGRHVYDGATVGFSPSELNFDDVVIGSSKTLTVKITNVGKQVGILYRSDMKKEGSSNFTIDLPEYISIDAGDSVEIPVTFTPQTEGNSSASISLCFSDRKKYDTLLLYGKGIQEESGAQLEFSTAKMNFGYVEVGKKDYQVLTIQNKGKKTATITGVTLPEGFQSGFYDKQTISAGSQGTITIVFLPKEVRYYSGNVVIETDTPESGFSLFVDGYGEAEHVAVSSISLDKTSASMIVGETLQLNVTFTPYNATNKKLKWSSDDESVVTVSDSGLVTALKVGAASIYVESLDGGKQASCFVAVNSNTPEGSHEGTGEDKWE